MTLLQQNTNTSSFIFKSINKNLSYSKILYKFIFNSNDLFEKKGKLVFYFPFSFQNLTIKIYSLINDQPSDLLLTVNNYKNTTYVYDFILDNIYIEVQTENNKYSRKIYLKNALNLKTSDYNFNPFRQRFSTSSTSKSENIIDCLLENLIKNRNKIDINYMIDFENCCKNNDLICDFNDLTLFFYDLDKINLQSSYMKISHYKWNDFKKFSSKKNKLNNFIYSSNNFKYSSQYKCAFSIYDDTIDKCKLALSPINHYQLIDNLLFLIKVINKDYSISQDNYRFLFNNPLLKSSDLIIDFNTTSSTTSFTGLSKENI